MGADTERHRERDRGKQGDIKRERIGKKGREKVRRKRKGRKKKILLNKLVVTLPFMFFPFSIVNKNPIFHQVKK